MTKAVIDRFEGDLAVLLVGDGERHLDVPRRALPPEAKEGQWLQVQLEGDTVVQAIIDEEETASAKDRIAEKLARLRRGEHRK